MPLAKALETTIAETAPEKSCPAAAAAVVRRWSNGASGAAIESAAKVHEPRAGALAATC